MHKRSLTHRSDTVVRRRSHQASTTFSGALPLNATDCSLRPNTRNARSNSLSPRPLRHGRAWLLHCAILVAALSSPHPDALAVSQQILHLLHTNLAVTPSIPHPTPSAPLHCKVPAPDSRYTPHSLSPPLAQDPESPSPAQSSTIPAVYPHDSNTRDSCSSGNASNALRQPESISPARGSSGYT